MHRFVVVLLVACEGGSGVPEFDRACDQSQIDGDCVHFTGSSWVEEDVIDACPTGSVVAECPPGAIGRCTIDAGLSFETRSYFYPAFYPGNAGSQRCNQQSDSTWTIL